MSDWTDDATELEERQRQAALAARVVYSGKSADECIECGDAIPVARQQSIAGCTMCTDCASMEEQRR